MKKSLVVFMLAMCLSSGLFASNRPCKFKVSGVLELVSWTRICDLEVDSLTGDLGQYEASGLHYNSEDGFLYVAFDNSFRILKVKPDWTDASLSAIDKDTNRSSYEALTQSPDSLLVMVERVNRDGDDGGKLIPYDQDLKSGPEQWTDIDFKTDNRGFEGLAWLPQDCAELDGPGYLLGLCEGNGCNDRKDNGNGRVVIMERQGQDGAVTWSKIESKVKLPRKACFKDYSGLAFLPVEDSCSDGAGEYVAAVISQRSSALWLGTLNTKKWTFSKGKVYRFPETNDGKELYGQVEGVTFLAKNPKEGVAYRIAVATDAHKENPACIEDLPSEPISKTTSDQSLFIFDIPSDP